MIDKPLQEDADNLRESVEEFIRQPRRDLMAEINFLTALMLFDKKPIVAIPDRLSPEEVESLDAKIHDAGRSLLRVEPNQIPCKKVR